MFYLHPPPPKITLSSFAADLFLAQLSPKQSQPTASPFFCSTAADHSYHIPPPPWGRGAIWPSLPSQTDRWQHMQHADAALGPWEARNWLGLQTSRTEVWQIGTNRTEWRTTYFSLNSGQKESATIPWFNEQCLTSPDACRPRPWDKWHLIHLTIVSTEPHRPIFVSHTNYGATQSTVRLF